ncbi:sigma-70 RNA polymerase sigma factor region 4 domain-containing protein [Paenibacillus massiliensis]|uniref:sigma-70 family RNA polymerase sigma factor n=1 Tax=Paenibacillus massiliensis TaxID=225917 RepID=UPI00041F7EF4|nr:sigma-70 family RNA polymerase sigma factor [Paenibacillus massiliensis]
MMEFRKNDDWNREYAGMPTEHSDELNTYPDSDDECLHDRQMEYYTGVIRRKAWRLQYQARSKYRRESPGQDYEWAEPPFTSTVEGDLWVDQVLDALPSATGREIMKALYLRNRSEKEVALELGMSQQGVNRWKHKMLHQLRQQMKL